MAYIRLRLDLGHRLLVFASSTNLESGPHFADIWYPLALHDIAAAHTKLLLLSFYLKLKLNHSDKILDQESIS